MRIDAHQHFWTRSRGDYGWLTPDLTAINRDFGADDLAPLLQRSGIEATVLVQAAATTAETDFMLGIAEANPFVRGVVGWIDFEDPRDLSTLARFAEHPKFRGVRPMIQDIPETDWMLKPAFDAVFRAIIDHDLTFDLLGFPRHLAPAQVLLKRYPELRVVLDHAMKPDIAAGAADDRTFSLWSDGMAAIAGSTRACCKLSGLVTEAGADWTIDRLRPYVTNVIDRFGPDRLMWGSDWPVVRLASDYETWHDVAMQLVSEAGIDQAGSDAIFGETARRFYRI